MHQYFFIPSEGFFKVKYEEENLTMVTSEKRLHVLKMVEEGKISASEAVRLLEESDETAASTGESQVEVGPHWLRIQVTDMRSGKEKVNLRLPVNLVNAGMKLGARLSSEGGGVSMAQIADLIQQGFIGQVIDVLDDEEDEHVQIMLE